MMWRELPLGADPAADWRGEVDELGRPVYVSRNGIRYQVQEPVTKERKPLAEALAGATPGGVASGAWDMAKGIVGGMRDAVTAPGRALSGEPVTNGQVMDLAGMVQLGGAAMPAPKGSLRIFAGRNAKTADLSSLEAAKRLAAEGVDRDQIWRQTGWGKGVDGHWKFEIDDSAAGLTDYAKGAISGNVERSGRLPDIMAHPDLDAAYPQAFGEVTVDNRVGHRGGYYPDTGAIQAMGPEPKGVRQTLLHEAQHAIQGKEGFAQGTSPGAMFGAHLDLKRRANTHRDAWSFLRELDVNGGDWDMALEDYRGLGLPMSEDALDLARRFKTSSVAEQAMNEMDAAVARLEPLRRPGQWQDDAGFGPYYRTAGEVEARNVQARADMTPDQRRSTPPWATQDTPDADQLLVYGDLLQLSARDTTAQQVARMLRDGRAADVTDDLMARVDPQEMHALYTSGATGADMPMDAASRMARARDMGFDTETPLYHGTAGDFHSFDTARHGQFGDDYGPAVFASSSPDVASGYAARVSGNPDWRALSSEHDTALSEWARSVLDHGSTSEQALQAQKRERGIRYRANAIQDDVENFRAPSEGGNVLPVVYNRSGFPSYDGGGEVWHKVNGPAIDDARGAGAPGLRIESVVDSATTQGAKIADTFVAFDPANIRSRFARFDPRLSHLANLSASNASPMVGLYSAQASADEKRRIEEYLRGRQ